MADNIAVTPGTGATVAADDIAGVLHQRVKISQGADGAATDVSSAAPLQVTLANTGANATAVKVDGSAVTQPVSGTVTANTGLTQPVTDTQLRATPVPVSGTITATVSGVATAANQATEITALGTLALETGGNLAAIKAKTDNIPAQGQALAASSLPVVLTAAQVTTLTPPAAITGFSTAAKQPALGTAGTASPDVITIQGIASGTVVPISVATIPSHAVTNAGTFAVQAAGPTASGSALTANPLTIGARAATTLPTVVADGQVVNLLVSKTGKQIVRHALREMCGNQQTTITSSTAETTIITADATYFIDVYSLIITNTSATATKVTIKDATAGTTRLVLQVPATTTVGYTLPASDGHKQAAINNNWTLTCGTSVASIEVTALFIKNL